MGISLLRDVKSLKSSPRQTIYFATALRAFLRCVAAMPQSAMISSETPIRHRSLWYLFASLATPTDETEAENSAAQ